MGGSACYPPTNLGTTVPVVSPAIAARKELGVSLDRYFMHRKCKIN
jgi:hypothetical protein